VKKNLRELGGALSYSFLLKGVEGLAFLGNLTQAHKRKTLRNFVFQRKGIPGDYRVAKKPDKYLRTTKGGKNNRRQPLGIGDSVNSQKDLTKSSPEAEIVRTPQL